MIARITNRLAAKLSVLVAGASIVGCAALDPELATPIAPGQTIVLADVEPRDSDLAATDGSGWRGLPEYRIELIPAPPVHSSITLRQTERGDQVGQGLHFQATRSNGRVWFRLRWHDASEDRDGTLGHFPDAIALQFALQDSSRTSYLMGTPDAPVNIWHWKGSTDRAENLAAGGFGSLTRVTEQGVEAASAYRAGRGGEWIVVFSRAIESEGEFEASFANSVPVAFAVWQGSIGQRDGDKLVSPGWVELRIQGES